MKIITLNTWGGLAGKEGILSFLREHKDDTDIFCLQEIWADPHSFLEGKKAAGKVLDHSQIMVYGLQEISALLTDFIPYFRPHHGEHYGLLMLVRKTIEVKAEGEVFVYKHKGYIPEGDLGNHARNIQYITTEFQDLPLTVINFHGLWNGQGKGDCDERLSQSKKISEFLTTQPGNIIMCGDFNLTPDTESLKLLEEVGLKNLVKDFGVTSTRTSHYKKPEKFADYILTSPSLNIKKFEVLPDEVSDHSPLCVEIE